MTSISEANSFSSFSCCFSIEILIFQYLVELLAQVFVLDQHLRDALLVKERHRGLVVHRLDEVVFAHVIAEPGIGLAFPAEKRRAGKGHILGIGQAGPHVLRQRLVLGAVGFIDDHDDVIPGRTAGGMPCPCPSGISESG